MITFSKFISEIESVHAPINKMRSELVRTWIYQKCQRYLSCADTHQFQIYRGMAPLQLGVVDTRSMNRVSKETPNWVNLWIDNMWTGYPKRSKSLICSTKQSIASGYGAVGLIIPSDDSLIGECPAGDIWESFTGSIFSDFQKSLDALTIIIREYMGPSYSESLQQNFPEFKKVTQEITDVFIDSLIEQGYRYNSVMKEIVDSGEQTLYDYLKANLNPKNNEFKHYKASKCVLSLSNEVWVQGECAVIPIRDYTKLVMDITSGDFIKDTRKPKP